MKKHGEHPKKRQPLMGDLVEQFEFPEKDRFETDWQPACSEEIQQRRRMVIQKILTREPNVDLGKQSVKLPQRTEPYGTEFQASEVRRKDQSKLGQNSKVSTESTKEHTEPSFLLVSTNSQIKSKNNSVTDAMKLLIVKRNLFRQCARTLANTQVEIINKVVYNEKSHVVALFKDYLIYDDIREFMLKSHSLKESIQKMMKPPGYCKPPFVPSYLALREKGIIDKANERKEKIRKIKEADLKKGTEVSTFFRTGYMDSLAKEDLLNSRSNLPTNSLECESSEDGLQIAELLKKLNECDCGTEEDKPREKAPEKGGWIKGGVQVKVISSKLRGAVTSRPHASAMENSGAKVKKGVKVKAPGVELKINNLSRGVQQITPRGQTRNAPAGVPMVIRTIQCANSAKGGSTPFSPASKMSHPPKSKLLDTYFQEHYTPRNGQQHIPRPIKTKMSGDTLGTSKGSIGLSIRPEIVNKDLLPFYKESGCGERSSSQKTDSYSSVNANRVGILKDPETPHSSVGIYYATKDPSFLHLNKKPSSKLPSPRPPAPAPTSNSKFSLRKNSGSRNQFFTQKTQTSQSSRFVCCSEMGHHKKESRKAYDILQAQIMRNNPMFIATQNQSLTQQTTPRTFLKPGRTYKDNIANSYNLRHLN